MATPLKVSPVRPVTVALATTTVVIVVQALPARVAASVSAFMIRFPNLMRKRLTEWTGKEQAGSS